MKLFLMLQKIVMGFSSAQMAILHHPLSTIFGYKTFKGKFLSIGGGLSNTRKREQRKPKITEIKANPQAKKDGLKLGEVQAKMAEANQFLSENSSEFL